MFIFSGKEDTNLVEREQGIKLHDSKVVTERNKGRNVDDILRAVPQVRQELGGTGSAKPNGITRQNVPVRFVR